MTKRAPKKKRDSKSPTKTAAKKATGVKLPDDDASASNLSRFFLIGAALLLTATAILLVGVYPSSAGAGAGMPVEIVIAPNTSADALATQLADAGIIRNPRYFVWYVRLTGGTRSIVSGTHLLTDDASPRDVMHCLERRSAPHVKVVVPEGWTRFDIAKRIDGLHVTSAHAFLGATVDKSLLAELHVQGDSAEGYLFPATYEFELDSEPQDLVRQMVRLFNKKYDALADKHDSGLKELSDTLGWTRREIVILASMIEKEAVVDDERAVIASVFLNRLRDPTFTPKRLQCDPTAGYGCLVGAAPSCLSYTGKITHEINVDPENAYSTYVHDGLPPGPISNPGAHSLEAVMSPALTHYFFFVAKGGGRHTFSETLGGHNAAVHGE